MDEKYLQELYNNLGGQSKFGAYNDFKELMSTNDSYRKQFHNTFGEKQLGSYNDFEGLVKKKDGGITSTTPTATSQTSTSTSQEPNFNFIDRSGNAVVHTNNDPVGNAVSELHSKKQNIINRNVSSDNTHIAHAPTVGLDGKVQKSDTEQNINAIDNDINTIKHNAFPDATAAHEYLTNKLQGKTAIKDNDVFSQPQTITPQTNLADFNLSSIKNNLDKGNLTDQLAFDKLQKDVNLNKVLNNSSDINEAAVKYAATQNPQLASQLHYLQSHGDKLPDAYEGELVNNFLHSKDLNDKAQNDPTLATHINLAKSNLYNQYPEYATKEVATKISQAREDAGLNNPFINAPSKESTDKLVADLVESGKMTQQDADIYTKNIRPELGLWNSTKRGIGRLFAPALIKESPLATSGFGESFENSLANTVHGMAKSIEDLPTPITNAVYGSDADKLKNVMSEDANQVGVNAKGLNSLGQSTGNLLGFITPMILGGTVLKAAGAPQLMNELVTGATVFGGKNYEESLKMFPEDKGKQFAYTTLTTGLDVAGMKLLPTKEAGEGLGKILKNDIKVELDALSNGEITAAAAKQNVLNKVTSYLGDVGKQNIHTASVMTGYGIVHNAIDAAFGGRDVKLADAAAQAIDTFSTTLLAATPLSLLSAYNPKHTGQSLMEMAKDPDYYSKLITDNAKIKPDPTADEKLQNLSFVTAVNKDLQETNLTDAQKEKYLVQSLAQKAYQEKAANTTDDLTRKDLLKKAATAQEAKEKIYSGLDKAPEHENEQPQSEQKEEPASNTNENTTSQNPPAKEGAEVESAPNLERTPEEIKQITREKVPMEHTDTEVEIPDLENYNSETKEVPLKKVSAFEGRDELRKRVKLLDKIKDCLTS